MTTIALCILPADICNFIVLIQIPDKSSSAEATLLLITNTLNLLLMQYHSASTKSMLQHYFGTVGGKFCLICQAAYSVSLTVKVLHTIKHLSLMIKNYYNTTKNVLFIIDISTSQLRSSSGLTFCFWRQLRGQNVKKWYTFFGHVVVIFNIVVNVVPDGWLHADDNVTLSKMSQTIKQVDRQNHTKTDTMRHRQTDTADKSASRNVQWYL